MNTEKIKSIVRVILATVTVIAILFGVNKHILGNFRGQSNVDARHINADNESANNKSVMGTVSKTLAIDEDIKNLNLDLSLGSVSIECGDTPSVSYELPAKFAPSLSVKDGMLQMVSEKSSSIFPGISMSDNYGVTIILPIGTKLDKASLNLDLGELNVSGLEVDDFSAEVDFGDINIDNIKAESFSIDEDMGDINIDNISATTLSVKQSAGDVAIDSCTAKDVTADSDLGSISFDGDCDSLTASCSMGDIDVTTKRDVNEMKLNLDVDLGAISVNGNEYK